jgi:hypothetical protein
MSYFKAQEGAEGAGDPKADNHLQSKQEQYHHSNAEGSLGSALMSTTKKSI